MSTKTHWTKQDEIDLINSLQDKYVNQLYNLIMSTDINDAAMKICNLTAPTGTGKTKMMAKLINKFPSAFFIVTTLSKGQLNQQITNSLKNDCLFENYIVYGAASYKSNTNLTEHDILDSLPNNVDIYWIRDEGHINTNKWSKVLESRCKKVINFSATNKTGYGVNCNFIETMMLRTVHQEVGSIQDALHKLIEIKKVHKKVREYNPCALFRVTTNNAAEDIIWWCEKLNLKAITLVDNNDYIMTDICMDNNKYDVIINKQKITEGVDIRRAHVIWMENKPNNPTTTIQAVGRCRRNALLWREDIDIFAPKMKNLLEQTRQCFVFYNIEKTKLDTNDGDFLIELCPMISIEKLHAGHTIYVENGAMPNGLTIVELEGKTGFFNIETDKETGFNVVCNSEFYQEEYGWYKNLLPGLDDLINKLLDKNSEYFKNLLISTKPYAEEIALWKYSVTYADSQNKKEQIYHMTIVDGITADGTLIVHKHTQTILTDKKHAYTIYPECASWQDQSHLSAMFRIGEELINQTNSKTVYFNSRYNTAHESSDYLSVPQQFFVLNDIYGTKYEIPTNILFDWIVKIQADESITAKDARNIFINYSPYANLNDNFKFNTTLYSSRLIAILGMEDFTQHKNNGIVSWIPVRSLTSKINSNTKLNRYIEQQYVKEINEAQKQCFSGNNNFNFQNNTNSCLGYCVEYYAKYLLFGEDYLKHEIDKAKSEAGSINANMDYVSKKDREKLIVVRACMIKHRNMIESRMGVDSGIYIPSMSVKSLSHKDSFEFINKVVELGTKASEFLKDKIDIPTAKNMCCDFITKHIVGVADFMDKNTIIDLKCTNHINSQMVKQVLGYHFLSQFRNDLEINKVIVYDAVSDKHIEIKL